MADKIENISNDPSGLFMEEFFDKTFGNTDYSNPNYNPIEEMHKFNNTINEKLNNQYDNNFYLKYGDAGGEIEVIDDIIKQANSQERTDLSSKLYYKKGEEYILAIGGRNIPINTPLYTSNGESLYSSANITYGEALKQGKITATTAYDRMDRTNPDNQKNNLNHLNYTNQKRVEELANGGEEAGKEFIERADIINEAKEREQASEQVRTGDMTTVQEEIEPHTVYTTYKRDDKEYDRLLNDYKNELQKQNENVKNASLEASGKINYTKKVSLNIAPVTKLNVANGMSGDEWEARAGYVLGDSSGLLYKIFRNDGGIVFPYTPKVDFEHTINYERTEIMHSNLAVSHYKNTPPPSINITADFTADGKNNAIYMFGVIHFLRSISKCEFGETMLSNKKREKAAGVPPPILYLNGYGNYMNNIPVVVKSFGISFDKNKHYVHLEDDYYKLDVWIPTDITITINLDIQFNLEKYKLQFDLNEYKKNTLGYNDDNNNYLIGKTKVFPIFNVSGTETLYSDKEKTNKIGTRNSSRYETAEAQEKLVRLNGSGWTW